MPNMIGLDTQAALESAPIDPSWITSGAPVTRNRVMFHSTDKTAWTMLWDCTAGEFDWIYSVDETIHFLEGGVIITGPDGETRSYGPGDVLFIPAGTVAHWRVETYIRKLAFCHKPVPAPLALPLRILRRVGAKLRLSMTQIPRMLAVSPPPVERREPTAARTDPVRTRRQA